MKLAEKLTQSAGIALNYIGGAAAIWFGAMCTALGLMIWGISGISAPLMIGMGVFGLTPLGAGIWLVRRGNALKQIFRVKLQKEAIRQLAFQRQGRLSPRELADANGWTEERAIHVLKNLAAEDPERVELQLDYDSGEIFFEFSDIRRALEAKGQYRALPISETVGRKAIEIAMTLGKTIDTFYEYVEFTKDTVSGHQRQKKEEQFRTKIERFLEEIDELKQQ